MMLIGGYEGAGAHVHARLSYAQARSRPGADEGPSLYPSRSGNFLIDLVAIARTASSSDPDPCAGFRVEPYELEGDCEGSSFAERGVSVGYEGSDAALRYLITEVAAAGYGAPDRSEPLAEPGEPEASARGHRAAEELIMLLEGELQARR
jgi:hypothetical protein